MTLSYPLLSLFPIQFNTQSFSGLFNLRASDIAYNPFFISYAILEQNRVRLYIIDKVMKLTATPSDNMTDVTMATHLNTGSTGNCSSISGECVEVIFFDLFKHNLLLLANKQENGLDHKFNDFFYLFVIQFLL